MDESKEVYPGDDPESDPVVLPAYYERWDGRRMIPNDYMDLFPADKDNFIEGLEGLGYEES